jgi:hypothetical protein
MLRLFFVPLATIAETSKIQSLQSVGFQVNMLTVSIFWQNGFCPCNTALQGLFCVFRA